LNSATIWYAVEWPKIQPTAEFVSYRAGVDALFEQFYYSADYVTPALNGCVN